MTAGKGPAITDVWIDVGGTFTDCIARRADGALVTHKLLSTGVYVGQIGPGSERNKVVDPARCGDPDGFFTGFQFTLADPPAPNVGETGGDVEFSSEVSAFDPREGVLSLARALPVDPPIGSTYVLSCEHEAAIIGIRWLLNRRLDEPIGELRVRLGTTRGTNALLERKGARTAFVTTAGFGDVLRIGYQSRPRLFHLHIRKPRELYEAVVELHERVDARGRVLKPLDERDAREKLASLHSTGVQSLAICLLNSYRNNAHEESVGRMARAVGFEHVSVSSRLSPLQRIVPRGDSTVIDAYLSPVIGDYVARLRSTMPAVNLKLMTSGGALVDAEAFVPKDSLLSGPAGGVVGQARVAAAAGFEKAIGFDMGGTSTDISRYDGRFERRGEMEVEDAGSGGRMRIVGDFLAIETVAAGGGSVCEFDGFRPIVGPASSGAAPGPACYGRGGPLCVTDCNVYLGRIPTARFPFPLDATAVARRLDELIVRIASASGRHYSREELATGYLAIANAHMAAAIRRVSIQRGYDPREYALVSFGGAGGQHACSVARELGIRTVLHHPLAGLLSAFGIGVADIARFAARDLGRTLNATLVAELPRVFGEMAAGLRIALKAEGCAEERIDIVRTLDLRYDGQDATLNVTEQQDGDWGGVFERQHRQLFGFHYADRAIEAYTARVHAVERAARSETTTARVRRAGSRAVADSTRAYFDGAWLGVRVLSRDELSVGARIAGPAIVVEPTSTVVVESGWTAELAAGGELLLRDAVAVAPGAGFGMRATDSRQTDPVALELFNSAFAAIAEEMGETLRMTAISTNVKERLDYSCAVYDARGELVSHAAHIPVHIGAMGESVKSLMVSDESSSVLPGEVWVTNDPYRGGSHLPDVTVVTPVFDPDGRSVLFFVANRAHHAEIGGVAPGSLSPATRNLAEEGVLIRGLRLLGGTSGGDATADERRLRQLFGGGTYPSRAVEQNLADLRAQIAANQRGAALLGELVGRHTAAVVGDYMMHLQAVGEAQARAALRAIGDGSYSRTEYLDDGAAIAVRITIRDGSAEFNFAGTSPVLEGNLNATPAIVTSAVLYCLRCVMGAARMTSGSDANRGDNLLMNAGVMRAVRIVLPECLLNPPAHPDALRCAAVAGGNVETSQRIVDAVFGALGVVAASQGTMNNLAFGNARFGYYETIAGGAGAGPTFDGASAVHTHMTNTRLTDPEVLEDRYPVRLRRFQIRRGSGGAGRRRGGDGVIREIEFLDDLDVSLLTQRRARPPYGLAGGQPGAAGANTLRRANGTIEPLASVCQISAQAGDVLTLETPGGGGYER